MVTSFEAEIDESTNDEMIQSKGINDENKTDKYNTMKLFHNLYSSPVYLKSLIYIPYEKEKIGKRVSLVFCVIRCLYFDIC